MGNRYDEVGLLPLTKLLDEIAQSADAVVSIRGSRADGACWRRCPYPHHAILPPRSNVTAGANRRQPLAVSWKL